MKLLAVIDYQYDFVQGALGFASAQALDAGIAARVEHYLAQGDAVVFTLDTHHDDYLDTREGRGLPIVHCMEQSEGWQLYGKTREVFEAARQAGGSLYALRKGSFGLFPQTLTAFADTLASQPEEIEVVGLVTNLCVLSCAVLLQAQWPNASITVDASLCLAPDRAMHSKALDVLEGLQMRIVHRA